MKQTDAAIVKLLQSSTEQIEELTIQKRALQEENKVLRKGEYSLCYLRTTLLFILYFSHLYFNTNLLVHSSDTVHDNGTTSVLRFARYIVCTCSITSCIQKRFEGPFSKISFSLMIYFKSGRN